MTTTRATHMIPIVPKPKFVTFDLYGTLTHFQMSARTRTLFSDRVPSGGMDEFLDDFEAYRFDEVLGAYKYYPDVIKDALRRACERWSIEYVESEGEEIAWDVPNWGPHPDVSESLARTAVHYPLVILSNAADVQIRHNVDKLGAPFHAVFTAEQARAYKPRFQAFEYMLEKLDCRRDEVLHVSSSTGGLFDEALMRAVDLLLSFPEVIVALFLIAILGPGYGTLVLALTITGWTPFARVSRGLALEVNARDYIAAAEVLGCRRRFIVLRHIIPNLIRPIAAISFLRFGHKLITVGALSFLGLGVQPPGSDWGAMLADARPYMERMPLLAIAPGLTIFVTALSVTMIGQGLEITVDRRMEAGATRGSQGAQMEPVDR